MLLLSSATLQQPEKQEAVSENRAYLPTMSNAAVTVAASSLNPNWVTGPLPYTKAGMRGGPRDLDLSKIIG